MTKVYGWLAAACMFCAVPGARAQYGAPAHETPRGASLVQAQAAGQGTVSELFASRVGYAQMFPNYANTPFTGQAAAPAPRPKLTAYDKIFPNYGDVGSLSDGSAEQEIPPRQNGDSLLPRSGVVPHSTGPMSSLDAATSTMIGPTGPMAAAIGNRDQFRGSGCNPCAPAYCPWFGGAAGLLMGRDPANKFWTTTDNDTCGCHLMNTTDARASTQGGAEFRFGRYIGGPSAGIGGAGLAGFGSPAGGGAIEAVYWTLAPFNGYATVFAEGTAPTELLKSFILMDANPTIGPYSASDYFTGASQQELWRRDYLQNLEINFWRLPLFAPTQRMQVNWMAGVRFFRFSEDLVYGSVSASTTHPEIVGSAAYLDTKVISNLVGFQIGGRANYFLWRALSVYAQPTMGVFGNHMTSRSHLYDASGNEGFDYRGSLNDVSLLGQIDVGTQWFITPRWSVFAAYRVLGVTGVALADNQLPNDLNDSVAMQDVHSNGSLILSGGVFGTWFAY